MEQRGLLFINWTENAVPIKDSEILDKLKKEWDLVKSGTQNKQFNICNEMIYGAIQILCMRGDIIAERIHFMYEGEKIERTVKPYGTSILPVASPKTTKLPKLWSKWMKEFIGF